MNSTSSVGMEMRMTSARPEPIEVVKDGVPPPTTVSPSVSLDESEPPSPLPGPPINFSEVIPGLYRSSFPRVKNFDFLEGLGLKTVLTLVTEEYPYENREFILLNGIKHVQIGIPAHKSEMDRIPLENLRDALEVLTNETYRPLLVHCNKGKHRTGCVVASFRKLCGWPTEEILAEYRKHAGSKARKLDELFIQDFDSFDMASKLGFRDAAVHSRQHDLFLTPPDSLKGMSQDNYQKYFEPLDGDRRPTVIKIDMEEHGHGEAASQDSQRTVTLTPSTLPSF